MKPLSPRAFSRHLALFLLLVLLFVPAAVYSAPPNPAPGSAEVDGDAAEWDLTADFFANMHGAGKLEKPLMAKLYLRYECATQTLFALILPVAPYTVALEPHRTYIKLGVNDTLVNGTAGDDGIAPDFHWIADSGNDADGWEASASLAPGFYSDLNVETQVWDFEGQLRRAAVIGHAIDLDVDCAPPTAVTIGAIHAGGTESLPLVLSALAGLALAGIVVRLSRR